MKINEVNQNECDKSQTKKERERERERGRQTGIDSETTIQVTAKERPNGPARKSGVMPTNRKITLTILHVP